MKKTLNGLLVSGFTWFLFTGGIGLFKMVNQHTGYKAILIFIVAALALILSIAQMYHLGNDMEIGDKARKQSDILETKKNDLPKV